MVVVSCTLDLTLPTNPIITARLSRGQLLLCFSHPMPKDGCDFFFWQTTNGDTRLLKIANRVGVYRWTSTISFELSPPDHD